MTHFICYFHF